MPSNNYGQGVQKYRCFQPATIRILKCVPIRSFIRRKIKVE